MNEIQDDEIDIYEMFHTLWEGKWIISTFVAIAILLSGGFLLYKKPVYESKLFLSIDNLPPYNKDLGQVTTKQNLIDNFASKFYSKKVFQEWKKSFPKNSLIFDDFSKTQIVDGFIMSKEKDDQLATFELEKKNTHFVLVKTDKISLMFNVFTYTQYVNEMLIREYVVQANEDLNKINLLFNISNSLDGNAVDAFLLINRFLDAAKKGKKIFSIQNPTMPKKVSPHSSLILLISLLLGGIIGVLYVFVSNSIRNRKEELAKL